MVPSKSAEPSLGQLGLPTDTPEVRIVPWDNQNATERLVGDTIHNCQRYFVDGQCVGLDVAANCARGDEQHRAGVKRASRRSLHSPDDQENLVENAELCAQVPRGVESTYEGRDLSQDISFPPTRNLAAAVAIGIQHMNPSESKLPSLEILARAGPDNAEVHSSITRQHKVCEARPARR